MVIFLNVFSKNSYNNQKNKNKPSKEHHWNKTIDNNKHYSLPFNNPVGAPPICPLEFEPTNQP